MDQFYSLMRKANIEFGQLVSGLDSTGWMIVAIAGLAIGTFLMRGNPVRSA